MKIFTTTFLVLCFALAAYAEKNVHNLGYKFHWDKKTRSGKCLNDSGKEGYNPQYLGTCGDLRGMDLSQVDLNGMNLEGANLDGLNLSSLQMNGTQLTGIKARGTNFSKTKLNGAYMVGADLGGAIFNRSELSGANLNYSDLSGSQFKHTEVYGTRFKNAKLGGAQFDSNLNTAHLKNASYSVGTKLPFAQNIAQNKGMIYQGPLDLKNSTQKVRVPASR